MHGRPKSTAAPFASTVVQRTRADGQLAERDVGIPHAGVPTRGLESRAFFVTVFLLFHVGVNRGPCRDRQSRPAAFVKRAGVRVVIDDAGRHRAAGRLVISEAPDTNHRPPW